MTPWKRRGPGSLIRPVAIRFNCLPATAGVLSFAQSLFPFHFINTVHILGAIPVTPLPEFLSISIRTVIMTVLDQHVSGSRLAQSRRSSTCDGKDEQHCSVDCGELFSKRRKCKGTTRPPRSREIGTRSATNSEAMNGTDQTSPPEVFTRDENISQSYRLHTAINLDPPVSNKSLSELDLCNIIKHPYLRHDLNFDSDLNFRPSGNAKIGAQRLLRNQTYWLAIKQELASYLRYRQLSKPGSSFTSGPFSKVFLQLRRMFLTIQQIIVTLVPEDRRASIRVRLDPQLLLQQMEHRVLDIANLGEWLGQQLMASCSPERDHLVLGMVSIMRRGALESDSRLIVDSLAQLFSILEIMKLVRFIQCISRVIRWSKKLTGRC